MHLLRRFDRRDHPTHGMLVFEGLLASAVGVFTAGWLFPDQASLVAVFLCTLASLDLIRVLVKHHQEQIRQFVAPADAHRLLWTSQLALFLGFLLGFGVLALVLPEARLDQVFGEQIADYRGARLEAMDFGSVSAILAHNAWTFLFFFVIALPFQEGGMALVLCWNASVWGATYGWLARNADGIGPLEAYLDLVTSCSVHMAAEAAAYILAGFSGLLLGRTMLKHGYDSDRVSSAWRPISRMLLVGACLLLVGASWEAWIAADVLQLLLGFST